MSRIYICDDQADYRTLLKAVLADDESLEVVGEGGDGAVCTEDVASIEPDVILLDVNMPGVSGLDAIPMLRERAPDTKIIMLTTARAQDCEKEAMDLGAHGFLQKPQNVMDLPALIRGKIDEISASSS